MTTLDEQQAYRAMFLFLEKFYELTGAEDIGGLLGSMRLLADKTPADPALWEDWMAAVSAASRGH